MTVALRRARCRAGGLRALGAFGVLALAALPADAQASGASLTVGAAQVRFTDEAPFTSLTITPALTLRGRAGLLALNATAAQVGAAGWSQQGTALGSLFTPVTRQGLMLEASASAGGTSYPGGFGTGQALGALRAHKVGDRGGLWIGGAAGSMYDGASWRRVQQAELGATLGGRYQRLSLLASPSVTDDTLRYTDILALYGTARGAWDVTLSVGARAGDTPPIVGGDQRLWGGANLQLWLSPRRALVIGVGTYPVDVTQGFPAGRYVSVGFRLGERRTLTAEEQAEAWGARDAAAAQGLRGFDVQRAGGDSIVLEVQAPRAARVEVSGDVTRWEPVPLARTADGRWRGRFAVGDAATVELALRVDGGAWIVPPGTEPLRDEFGGQSGRLILPPCRDAHGGRCSQ